MSLSYNPETGEALYLEGNEWKPARIASNEAGDKVAWDGVAWKPLGQKGEAIGPWGAGMKRAQSSIDTAIGAAAHAFGAPETSKRYLDAAAKTDADVDERYKPKMPDWRNIGGPLDAGQFLYEKFAESAPIMGATMGAGVAGALALPAAPIVGSIAAGTAAGTAFAFGDNVQEQMSGGRTIDQVNKTAAAVTAPVQALADSIFNVMLPRVGKAATGGLLTRAIKKGWQGAAIEAPTETIQEALTILQSDPTKLFSFPPAVRDRLVDAAVAGGALGGTIGGASGVVNRRKEELPPAPSSPVGEESPTPIWRPNGTGMPIINEPLGLESGTGLPNWTPTASTPSYLPNGTGLPITNEALGLDSGTGLPDMGTNPPDSPRYLPNKTGLPGIAEPEGLESGTGLPDAGTRFKDTGGLVYKDVQQKLLAVRQAKLARGEKAMSPNEVNANATMFRKRYEQRAQLNGSDPLTEYRRSGMDVTDGTAESVDRSNESLNQTLNQEQTQNESNAEIDKIIPPGSRRKNFKEWAGGSRLFRSKSIDRYTDGPGIFEVFHGTTHPDIEVVNTRSDRNNKTGFLGGGFYTSTNRHDTSENYAGSGPDLQGRVHNKVDELTDVFAEDDKFRYDTMRDFYNEDTDARGRAAAHLGLKEDFDFYDLPDADREKLINLSGTEALYRAAEKEIKGPTDGLVMPLYVKLSNPFNMKPEAPSMPKQDQDRLASALRRVGAEWDIPEKSISDSVNQIYNSTLLGPNNHYKAWRTIGHALRGDIKYDPDGSEARYGQFIQEVARKAGFDGMIMDAHKAFPRMSGVSPGTLHVVPFDGTQVKSVFNRGTFSPTSPNIMQQRGKKPGSPPVVQANYTGAPHLGRSIIRLLKTADESSFMHESMHMWLNEMVEDAPSVRSVAHDLQVLRDWVGNKGEAFTRKQHEMIARGWEQFLRTGKAPNKSLTDIFKQFAQWLTEIYSDAKQLGVTLSPEVEAVYGRLIAQTESITAAEKQATSSSPIKVKPIVGGETYTQTYEQSGRANIDDLREGMPRSNDNIDDRSFTAEFHTDMAKSYNDRAKAYDKRTSEWKGYAEKAMADRRMSGRDLPGPKAQAFLDGMESYKKNAAEARATRDEHLSKAARLNVRTFDQASADPEIVAQKEERKSIFNGNAALRWTKAVFDPFSNVPNSGDFRDARNQVAGSVYAAEQSATKAKNLFAKASLAEKNLINKYMETPNADVTMVPLRIRPEVVSLKKYINGPLKQALIDRNLLPESDLNKNDDSYLPRLYLKHLLENKGVKGSGVKLSRVYAKSRDEQTPEAMVAMGEVKDPAVRMFYALFRPQRDLAVMNFFETVGKNKDWAREESLVEWNGHKVTPFWLKSEADAIIERRLPSEPDPVRKTQMKEVADQMREKAAGGLAAIDDLKIDPNYDPREWRKIPDMADYGPLRGMIVREQIASDIIGTTNFVKPDNTIDKFLGDRNSALTKGISAWKFMKVPLNPPSQMRNFISNMLLAQLSGIPIHHLIQRFAQAAKQVYEKKGKHYEVAEKYGVISNTMTEQELFAISDELKRLELAGETGFAGWRSFYRTILKVGKKAGDLHQAMEVLGKVAVIADAMERQKMEAGAAVRHANKWLFDYSEVIPSVRRLRQMPIGMPFACVDPKTEILTARGWLKHDQLAIGDMAASFDMGDEHLKWRPVTKIFQAPYKGEMVHVKDRHLDMFMTPDHRVVTYRRRRAPGQRTINEVHKSLEIQQAKDLTVSDHIPVAAPFIHEPVGQPISNAIAEFLGWYVSEGFTHPKCDAVWLCQNEGPKADQIRDVLRKNNFGYREDRLKDGGGFPRNDGTVNQHIQFYIRAKHGKKIREICPNKKLTPEIVMRMTTGQIRLFMDAFIAGDGSVNKTDGRRVIIQKDKGTLDALQMGLTILGESYGLHKRPCGTSSISIRDGKSYCIKRGLQPNVQYDGVIWCPQVEGTATWVARRNGKVFITHNTFSYKILPLMAEVMTKHPTRMLPWIALGATIPALVATSNDIDQDDAEKLRKSLSSNLRRKSDMYLLPWKDAEGRWQFVDVGYFMPWQMPWDIMRSLGKAGYHAAKGDDREATQEASDALRASGIGSGPVVSLIAAFTTGIDPFTGRPIADKRDPMERQVMDITGHLWNLAVPSLVSTYGAAGQMIGKESGTGVNRYGEPQTTYGQIAARTAGLNVTPVMPDAQRARNIKLMQREIQDEKSRMTQTLRDQSLTMERRRSISEDFRKDIMARQKKMMEYARDSAMSPKLRAASQIQ